MTSFLGFCQQITRDASSLNQVIGNDAGFTNFFSMFVQFLDQYRKPYSKSVFKKNPIKLVSDALKTVEFVIKETKPGNYNREMIPFLDKAFQLLLHPDNAKKIRVSAVYLYFKLMKRLDAASEVYIGKIAPLVFNFRLLQPKCSPTSNLDMKFDDTARINAGEAPKEDLETLMEEITVFTKKLCKYLAQDKFVNFVYFFRTMLLDVAYPADGASYGIKGVVPAELQERILEVMIQVVDSSKIFGIIYRRTEPLFQRYFFDVASNCRKLAENPNELRYLELFFVALSSPGDNLIAMTQIRYILQGLNVLLGAQVVLGGMERRDSRRRLWDLLFVFLSNVIEKFQGDDVLRAVEMLVDWTDVGSLPNVLCLLIGVLLATNCQNEQVWDILKRGAQVGENRCTYWTVIGNFASYYGFCLVDRILKFDLAALEGAIAAVAPLDKWTNTKESGAAKFAGLTSDNRDSYFKQHENEVALTCFPDVFLPVINVDVGVSEAFLKLMLSLRWMDATDEKEQWYLFFVAMSFIFPLVVFVDIVPSSLSVDVSFIFNTFFDWMMNGLDPGLSNPEIISTTFKHLGTLMCSERSRSFHTDDILASWYSALTFHLKSMDQKILKYAVMFACKSVLFGMRGNSVLYTPLLDQKSLTENVTTDKLPALFFRLSAPIKLYNSLDERIRCSAITIRMIKDAVEGNTDDVKKEVDVCIELLKAYDKWQVVVLQPTILLLVDKLQTEYDRILECLLSLLQKPPSDDAVTYEYYARFTCSLVIYGASETGLQGLEQISKEWTDQSLQYLLLMTAMQFNRYPKYIEGSMPDTSYPSFKTNNDHILGATNNRLISAFPVGYRIWDYAPACDMPKSDKTESLLTPQVIPTKECLEFPFQSDMCGTIEKYVQNMFADTSILTPAAPSDFSQLDAPVPEPQKVVDVPAMSLRDTASSMGPNAANFLSSMAFFAPVENRRLFPSYSPMDPYQCQLSCERVDIGLISANNLSAHLEEFKTGLGFPSRAGDGIITYRDVFCELVFHTKADLDQCRVQVVWCDGMDPSWLLETYSKDAFVRMEIRINPDGRFTVRTLLHKSRARKLRTSLGEVIVSKKILPLFVLSRLRSLTTVVSKPRNVLLEAGVQMRSVTEQSFFDQDDAFSSEKALLLSLPHDLC